MAFAQAKAVKYEPQSSQKGPLIGLIGEVAMRTMGIAATLIAIGVMITSKQSTSLFGVQIDAQYSYSPILKYFVVANACSCFLSAVSLAVFSYGIRLPNPDRKKIFIICFIDLIVTMLALTGCSAASAIGILARYGNSHTGWMPICDNFGKFCGKMMVSIVISYTAVFLFVVLTVLSAWNLSKVQVSIY